MLLQIASEKGDRKYKDRDGRRFTFSEVLHSSFYPSSADHRLVMLWSSRRTAELACAQGQFFAAALQFV